MKKVVPNPCGQPVWGGIYHPSYIFPFMWFAEKYTVFKKLKCYQKYSF